MQWDEALFRAVHVGLRREWLDPVMVAITATGLGAVQAALLLGVSYWKRFRPYAWACLACFAVAGILRNVIAHPIDRVRPSNFPFSKPLEDVYMAPSWPSGHSTTAFAIAFMLGLLLKGRDCAWVAWLAFGWACLVGLSRLYVGVHYPTDVLGGAALGLATACGVWLVMKRRGWLPDEGE